jgi:tagatose 1,6-diphosphate aldolase
MPLSLGKMRHLARCITPDGRFLILAIDHRANLRDELQKQSAAPLTDADITAFKQAVTRALLPYASGLLTDPTYGITEGILSGVIDARKGLLAPLEVTDYSLHPSERDVNFIPDWSVEHIKRVGGDGVKLLLYYHPDAPTAAIKRTHVERIVAECAKWEIPFFLEPIAYSLDPQKSLSNAELLDVSIEMAKLFSGMDVDILKMSFPVDVKQSHDVAVWRDACERLHEACGQTPWALLSGGVSYATFAQQARVACAAGAQGVIVGRAVWADAIPLKGSEREEFLEGIAAGRMRQLDTITAQSLEV